MVCTGVHVQHMYILLLCTVDIEAHLIGPASLLHVHGEITYYLADMQYSSTLSERVLTYLVSSASEGN